MINRIAALIWLRTQVLLSNSSMLVTILLPYGMLLLYNQFMNTDGSQGVYILYMCLSMAFSISVGNLISVTIAEEKEKNNLKSLMLSGVRNGEYLTAILFYPVVLALVTIVAFPLLVGVDLSDDILEYAVVASIVALCVILLNLLVGSVSDTQSKAQVNGLIPMMAIAFLPLFSNFSEPVKTVMNYTFMGMYAEFFSNPEFTLSVEACGVALLWLVALFVINLLVLNPTRRATFTAKFAKVK